MSKSGTKKELLSAIQDQFSNLLEGNISLENLETFVEQTRELHEFAVVLRYKAHEEQLFPERSKQFSEVEETFQKEQPTFKEELKAEVPKVSETIVETAKEVQIEKNNIFENEVEKVVAPTIFDFSLFDPIPEVETKQNLDAILNEVANLNELTEEPASKEEITSPENQVEQPIEEPITKSEVSAPAEDTNLNIEYENSEQQEANDVKEEEEYFFESNLNSDLENYSSADLGSDDNNNTDKHLDEVNTAFQEVSQKFETETEIKESQNVNLTESTTDSFLPETNEEQNNASELEIDPINVKLNAIVEQASNSMGLAMMSIKLDTLIGSFGFNEKYQFIHELFKGSLDDFNQAVEVLDGFQNLDQAKEQLVYYTKLNAWDLDKETSIEFVRKISRRYS